MKESGYVESKSRGSFDREGLVTLAGQLGEVAVVCPIGAELPLDVGRHCTAIQVAFAAPVQIGLEERLYHPIDVTSRSQWLGSKRSRLLFRVTKQMVKCSL